MGIGVSLFLIAVGAILTWAVNATVSGLDIQTIGVILLVVGLVGLVLSLMFWSSWGGSGGDAPAHHVRRGRPGTRAVTAAHLRDPREAACRAASLSVQASGSSNENVEPRARLGLDPDPAVHAADDLAADVEAEPGAADAAGQVRVEPVELLEDRAVLGGRDPEALVGDREPDAPVRAARARPRRGRRRAST